MNSTSAIPDAPVEDRLAFAITEIARQSPDRPALVAGAGSASRRAFDYSMLAAAVEKLEAALDAHRPVGVVARAARVESLVAIAAACGRQHVPVAFLAEDSRDLVGELRDWVTLDDSLALPESAARGPRREFGAIAAQVVVATSGTSGPPTLLRRLLTSADRGLLAKAAPTRITLGGEAADGPLLADAQAVFPQAKITQVYATTELGEVFRVADGRPGFPAAWLGKSLPGGVRLATRRDGELLVQLSRDTAEVGTGDLVERRGDRCEFTGRRSDVIVVGGAKVFPKRVEEILRRVPGVAEARVYGLPSAITGELVAAEIVLAESLPGATSPDQVRTAALAVCREALEPQSVPRVLDIVKHIATTAAGKTPRRPLTTTL